MTGRLTVNAGLRYELNTAPVDVNNRMVIFDPATAALLPVGAERRSARRRRQPMPVNFAPRVGAAWTIDSERRLIVRGGYGIFYDSGTLIENSALYFNPPYFGLTVFVPGDAAADGGQSLSLGERLRAASLGEHARARVEDGIRAAGQPGRRCPSPRHRRHGSLGGRMGRESGAEAQSESAVACAWPCGRAASDCGLRRRAARRAGSVVCLSRAAGARGAIGRARSLAARGVDLGQVDRRSIGVSRQRGQRQHAAEQQQPGRGARAVGLRRPASLGGRGDLADPGGWAVGLGPRLAGQRAADGADGSALHASRQFRQQQYGQSRRAVRVRPAE